MMAANIPLMPKWPKEAGDEIQFPVWEASDKQAEKCRTEFIRINELLPHKVKIVRHQGVNLTGTTHYLIVKR